MDNTTLLVRLKSKVRMEDLLDNSIASGSSFKFERLHRMNELVEEARSSSPEVYAEVDQKEIEIQLLQEMSEAESRMYQTYKVEIDESIDFKQFQEYLRNHKDVAEFELDQLHSTQDLTLNVQAPDLSDLYGLDLIEAPKAWSKSTGKDVVVAVVDTGVDYNHPDITSNMWQDQKGNFGYNFVNDQADPMDDQGHGTHVAGTIAAIGNNNLGIVGVAPSAKVMAVKCLFPVGNGQRASGYTKDLAKGIKYAADNGAKIINNSWGPGNSFVIRQAIAYASSKNCIVVFAAGNENKEVVPESAAGNVSTIAVAATNRNDAKTSFSNYGPLVDVSAPGLQILSLKYGGTGLERKSGTSMACPHVSGLIALVLAIEPNLSEKEIRSLLIENVDPHYHPVNASIGTGRINARKVIERLTSLRKPTPIDGPLRAIVSYSARIDLASSIFQVEIILEDKDALPLDFENLAGLEAMVIMLKTFDCAVDQNSKVICRSIPLTDQKHQL